MIKQDVLLRAAAGIFKIRTRNGLYYRMLMEYGKFRCGSAAFFYAWGRTGIRRYMLEGPLARRDPASPVKRWNAKTTGNNNLAVAA